MCSKLKITVCSQNLNELLLPTLSHPFLFHDSLSNFDLARTTLLIFPCLVSCSRNYWEYKIREKPVKLSAPKCLSELGLLLTDNHMKSLLITALCYDI